MVRQLGIQDCLVRLGPERFVEDGSPQHDLSQSVSRSLEVGQVGAKPVAVQTGDFQPVEFGTLAVATAGVQAVSIRYVDGPGWKPVNMRSVTLTPVP